MTRIYLCSQLEDIGWLLTRAVSEEFYTGGGDSQSPRLVVAANGGVEADVHHRVNEGCKVLGALKGVMKNRGLGMDVKKVFYEKVVVPTVMCAAVMGYESN